MTRDIQQDDDAKNFLMKSFHIEIGLVDRFRGVQRS